VKAAQDKRARVLRVDGRGRMYVRAIPFEYNPAARTAISTAEMNFAKNEKNGKLEIVDEKTTDVPAAMPVAQSAQSAQPPLQQQSPQPTAQPGAPTK
jgi:hypothetical protein